MEQLEDLSKIIRERDGEVDSLKEQIQDLQGQNRQLHNQMTEVKRECAELTRDRGIDMLQKSN
jgi:peptidoglycan hydrolase CwlO-like protein